MILPNTITKEHQPQKGEFLIYASPEELLPSEREVKLLERAYPVGSFTFLCSPPQHCVTFKAEHIGMVSMDITDKMKRLIDEYKKGGEEVFYYMQLIQH